MQTVFLPAKIEGNPVRPISSMQACNRIIPVVMAPPPYVGRSQTSPCQEMAEALAPVDVQGQIKHLKYRTIVNDIPGGNPVQVLPIPSHSPSKNAGVCENEDEHDSLPQPVFDYGDLLPLNIFMYPTFVILFITGCV